MYEPETDWEEIYLTVRGSFIGSDFPAERFLRTPVRALRALLSRIDYQEKYQANLVNASTAQLTHFAHQYMQIRIAQESQKPKKPKDSVPDDFLPFPKLKPPEDESQEMTQRTKQILSNLIKEFRIPMHAFLTLSNPPKPTG